MILIIMLQVIKIALKDSKNLNQNIDEITSTYRQTVFSLEALMFINSNSEK